MKTRFLVVCVDLGASKFRTGFVETLFCEMGIERKSVLYKNVGSVVKSENKRNAILTIREICKVIVSRIKEIKECDNFKVLKTITIGLPGLKDGEKIEKKTYCRRTILGWMVSWTVSFSGIDAIFYYSNKMFEDAGLEDYATLVTSKDII